MEAPGLQWFSQWILACGASCEAIGQCIYGRGFQNIANAGTLTRLLLFK